MNASVLCREVGITVPNELQWYGPQCRLVSSDPSADVYQLQLQTAPLLGNQGKAVLLVFKSYQQSQGGKYECRVRSTVNEVPRLQVLPLLVGECCERETALEGCAVLHSTNLRRVITGELRCA